MASYVNQMIYLFTIIRFESLSSFIGNHWIEIVLALLFAVIVEIGFKPIRNWKTKSKKMKAAYSYVGRSSKLKPEILLLNRPYNSYYYDRKEDELILDSFKKKQNMLILGSPLSGKTRSIISALKKLNKSINIAVPTFNPIDLASFKIPHCTDLIILDDLHRLVDQSNFFHLLRKVIQKNIRIVASCQSGIEFTRTSNSFVQNGLSIKTLFNVIVEHKAISTSDGKIISENVGIPWNAANFDGNIGSLFLPLDELTRRYNHCEDCERTILQSIKALHIFDINDNNTFPLKWIKLAASTFGLNGTDYQWHNWLQILEGNELIKCDRNYILVIDIYLDRIVTFPSTMQIIEIADKLVTAFKDYPDVLIKQAGRLYIIGTISQDIVKFMHLSIIASTYALISYPKETFPLKHADIQTLVGKAFLLLSGYEEKEQNARSALEAFDSALELKASLKLSYDCAELHNYKGIAFSKLGCSVNNTSYFYYSIDSYHEALAIRTRREYPLDYALTQNNLALVYYHLAKVENKHDNTLKSIACLEKALVILTKDYYPVQYAYLCTNFGNAYMILAETSSQIKDYKLALEWYLKAKNINSFLKYPIEYSTFLMSLGKTYDKLAELENPVDNTKNVIVCFSEAIKFFTYEKFPADYSISQKRIGTAFLRLADFENTIDNCRNAIKAFNNALKFRTPEHFPSQYSTLQTYIGNTFIVLAENVDPVNNCRLAIEAYKQGIQAIRVDVNSIDYAIYCNNMGNAYHRLSFVEHTVDNINLSISFYQESIKIYTKDLYPTEYANAQQMLGCLYFYLLKIDKNNAHGEKAIAAFQEALSVVDRNIRKSFFTGLQFNLEQTIQYCEKLKKGSL